MASSSTSSIHSRFMAGFVRQPSGELIHCFGPCSRRITSVWSQFQEHVLRNGNLNTRHSSSLSATQPQDGVESIHTFKMQFSSDSYVIFESVTPLDQQVFGLVLNREAFVPATLSAHLDSFFAELILSRLALDTKAYTTALGNVNFNSVVDSIVDLFDSSLRYVAKNDKWSHGGREVFRQQVGSFVSRGAKVEFCLPAFPCKSSSKNKVLSDSPDRGEHIALSNLHTFIQKIEAVYPPGGKLWIISDGHVFSDCSKYAPNEANVSK